MGLEQKVWFLERGLFELFPEQTKEEWDNVGLIVGDKEADVEGIAIALDASVEMVDQAAANGCNVLLTHHPVFLKAPHLIVEHSLHVWSSESAARDSVEQVMAGSVVIEAMRRGVNLIAMHTNFDYSPKSQHALPDALGLTYLNPIEQVAQQGAVGHGEEKGGMGQLSSTPTTTLMDLAIRCKDVFGATPRIWGDPQQRIEFVGTCPGSAWPLINDASRCEFDCFICGETRYHTARAAAMAGISVIELGHDVSEMLFKGLFRTALLDLGYHADRIVVLEEPANWWTI